MCVHRIQPTELEDQDEHLLLFTSMKLTSFECIALSDMLQLINVIKMWGGGACKLADVHASPIHSIGAKVTVSYLWRMISESTTLGRFRK